LIIASVYLRKLILRYQGVFPRPTPTRIQKQEKITQCVLTYFSSKVTSDHAHKFCTHPLNTNLLKLEK